MYLYVYLGSINSEVFLLRPLWIVNYILSQKFCQKISVIKTNSFDWELFTFDDIKKIGHFGILIHVLS